MDSDLESVSSQSSTLFDLPLSVATAAAEGHVESVRYWLEGPHSDDEGQRDVRSSSPACDAKVPGWRSAVLSRERPSASGGWSPAGGRRRRILFSDASRACRTNSDPRSSATGASPSRHPLSNGFTPNNRLEALPVLVRHHRRAALRDGDRRLRDGALRFARARRLRRRLRRLGRGLLGGGLGRGPA